MSTAPPPAAGKLRRPKHVADANSRMFNAICYGRSGVGKTSLAATCPGPVLVIDCENGISSLRNPDPRLVKAYDLEVDASGRFKDLYFETVRTRDELTALIARTEEELRVDPNWWGTIVLDSLSELQRICIMERLRATKQILLEMMDWNVILLQMEAVIRTLRSMPVHTLYISQEKADEKKGFGPELSGQISRQLIYHVDIMCRYCLFEKEEDGANGKEAKQIRKLRMRPSFNPVMEAKSRFFELKDWEEPDIKQLIEKTASARSKGA